MWGSEVFGIVGCGGVRILGLLDVRGLSWRITM